MRRRGPIAAPAAPRSRANIAAARAMLADAKRDRARELERRYLSEDREAQRVSELASRSPDEQAAAAAQARELLAMLSGVDVADCSAPRVRPSTSTPVEPLTCPRCGAVSHNANDRKHGYCARCDDFTAPPAPSGGTQ
jgi:hypothetical protein